MKATFYAIWIVLLLFGAHLTVATPIEPAKPAAGAHNGGPAPVLPTGAHVAILKIRGPIYGYTVKSLEQRVEQAVRMGSSLIVVELDTKGGLVDSALKISRFIKNTNVPFVAWINPEAYSAGIIIAAACNQIVMAPASATGDCAPISPLKNLAPTERAKALSPILEEFRDSARIHRYDYVLFHAMCVLGFKVYRIENPDTGQRRLVGQSDYRVMVEGALPDLPTAAAGDTVAGSGDVADSVTPPGEVPVAVGTRQDRGRWRLVERIHDGTSLLTLSQQRAIDLGLAQAIVRDPVQLKQHLGAATVTPIPPSRVAMIAYWLTLPWIRALLMFALFVGFYIELQTPGFGAGGTIAIAALLLLLVAPFLVGLAHVWHVILFLIGLALLLAEVTILPGFGVAGISGITCMFIGLVLMVVPTSGGGPVPMPAPEMAQRLTDSVLFALVGVIGSGVAFYYLTKHAGGIPWLNRLILRNPLPGSPGPALSCDGPIRHDDQPGIDVIQMTPGATGRVLTQLRPSGRAEFDGQVVDVISRGEWVEPTRRIRVVEVHGNRIIVEPEET